MTTFIHQLHSGCLFLANEIAANVKSTSRLKFKSTGLECSDANKTPTTCVELKGKFFPAHRNCAETESVSCFVIYALAAYQLVVHLSVTPKTANKGAVRITDPLFEVNLVPSELLCPLWMEKFVQIG